MAKTKKKGGFSSNKPNIKDKKKKLNPFEVHVNKEKINVLGKKSKNDRGLPGVSREKALNKRKATLLQEYKLQNKSNKFFDKRIGERDENLTQEDKFVARYAKIRARQHKQSKFNLADEVLTHRGQLLSEIEKFDDPRSDDDGLDEDDTGKLDSNFVGEAHFGGGLFKKVGEDGAKSHKDIIDQLISESKKRKQERQKLKEQTTELTEKLDTEWKDLLPLVNKSTKADNEEQKADDFDKAMRMLKFEARGKPSDRLKTEDEIAKEEKEKLEELEQERLQRMHGFTPCKSTRQMKSADDLDDNFVFEKDLDISLSYNVDGLPNVEISGEINGKKIGEKTWQESDSDENGDDDEEMNEAEVSDDGEEAVEEEEDNLSDLKESESEVSEDEAIADHKSFEEDDLLLEDKTIEGDENTEDEDVENVEDGEDDNIQNDNNEKILEKQKEKVKDKEQIRLDLSQRKQIMEKARQELPYTFKIPENYKSLQDLLTKESPERQNVIMERMVKCNHPSLAEHNKENLGTLFLYSLQYLNDISSSKNDEQSIEEIFKIFYNILPHIFDLAHLNAESTHNALVEVIKEKHLDYQRHPKKYPGIDILLYFKLISYICSTSDFKHSVVTPSFVFIDQMLNSCKVKTRRDIAFGLFLTTIVFEYTTLSKRFLPSAINFLAGVLYVCIPKTGVKVIKIAPPFKLSSNHLVMFNNWAEKDLDLKLSVKYLANGDIDDEFKIKTFYIALSLIEEFINNSQEYPSNCEILNNIETYLEMMLFNNYPLNVRLKAEGVKEMMKHLKENRNILYIVSEKARPKALRLYEPNIQKVYDRKTHKSQTREKAETDKLLHKLKREHKGAVREIRRDKAFLGRVKINRQIQSDTERKEKVKRLFAEASMQQCELNAMDRKRKKKFLFKGRGKFLIKFFTFEEIFAKF